MAIYDSKCAVLASTVVLTAGLFTTASIWAASGTPMAAEHSASADIGSMPSRSAGSIVELRLAMMDDMKQMGSMGSMSGAKKGANRSSNGSMQMPAADSGSSASDPMATPSNMDMMGRMRGNMQSSRGMNNMPSTSLPGFPGASRLYHVGATGFFLDHPQHITLSATQQSSLNQIMEKALLERATVDRRIEDAEQELWTLTAAESPDITKIEAKVRAIEKMRSDQRLAFIRAVGDAGKILTADQRAAVLGTKPPAKAATSQSSPAPSKTDPMPAAPAMKHN